MYHVPGYFTGLQKNRTDFEEETGDFFSPKICWCVFSKKKADIIIIS